MVWGWIAAAWLSGSLMFSYWLGLIARHDLKAIGDGNPGGANLIKAAGVQWGLAGIALDFLKGYVPLALLLKNGLVGGYALIPLAAAPVLGHAFSPFMKFKGGKAIAVTFGVWSALTHFEVSLVYAIILAVLMAIDKGIRKGRPSTPKSDAFQVVLGMLLVPIYLYAANYSEEFLWCWLVIFAILVLTHRREIGIFLGRIFHPQ
ncbi:glycerol-3-phosphate acyltransferase [Cohnella terricola]|uniref:Glycerol-3-phosphate acyltransferase n=1 Tax=Cohnella terricola TaxID=1289167 RepID=A0A559JNI1_9BACL|nr:glycerol-3-phosphate acyltransferase [Cohnella terricola]TVY01439.1 glycerol-3-phosphate acyltransferase [Cohnella terricola]